MKKIVLSLLLFIPIVGCCSNLKTPPRQKIVKEKVSFVIKPDSVVIQLLGDSVCDLIFAPSKVKCCTLNSMKRPQKGDATILGYSIKKEYDKIPKNAISILQFILSDSSSYNRSNVFPAAPFIPTVVYEFYHKKDCVDLAFSFMNGEIAVLKNGKQINSVRFNFVLKRSLMLFTNKVINDGALNELLNIK
jgi:hypothetical protein